jgi:hypothetical protein
MTFVCSAYQFSVCCLGEHGIGVKAVLKFLHSLSKNPRNRHSELVSESKTAGKEIAGQARNDSLQDCGSSPQ